jgi:carbon storage regulator
MLVLSRKRHEKIVIGGNIVVEVIDFDSRQVRLGVYAPPEVPVHRQEIADRIERERRGRDGQD